MVLARLRVKSGKRSCCIEAVNCTKAGYVNETANIVMKMSFG